MSETLLHRYNQILRICQSKFLDPLSALFEEEAAQLFLWIPVCLAIGIGLFFVLPTDPALFWCAAPLILFSILLRIHLSYLGRILVLAAFWISLGFTCALIRTEMLDTPFLSKSLQKYRLKADVIKIESHPKGVRAVVKPRNIKNLANVRIMIKDSFIPKALEPGTQIQLRATLFPPSTEVIAGGYNFRRKAYFDGISAIGYATSPVKVLKMPKVSSFQNWLEGCRQEIRETFQVLLSQETAPIAMALTIADRNGIPDSTRQAYADAGLAHILAISGLHMSLIAGIIFFIVLWGLACIPWIPLHYNIKKGAALLTLLMTGFYLMLCWGAIPAMRAFLMTSLIMVAILLDRQAISLRNVALAATILLIFLPESLLSASFQLSFAAVIGLVTLYDLVNTYILQRLRKDRWVHKGLLYIFGILLTTLVANIFTMPFTAYTFQQIQLYGIFSNLICIPLTAFLLMPSLLLTTVLIPFGLADLTAPLLEFSISLLTQIATSVSSLPQTTVKTPIMPDIMLGSLTLCALSLLFWRGRLRWSATVFGVGVLISTLYIKTPIAFSLHQRNSHLSGFVEGDTLYLSSVRKNRFVQEVWAKSARTSKVKRAKVSKESENYTVFKTPLGEEKIILNQKYRIFERG